MDNNMLMATLGIATELQNRVDRLEAINAELLGACKIALNTINLNDETLTARYALESVIAKAKDES